MLAMLICEPYFKWRRITAFEGWLSHRAAELPHYFSFEMAQILDSYADHHKIHIVALFRDNHPSRYLPGFHRGAGVHIAVRGTNMCDYVMIQDNSTLYIAKNRYGSRRSIQIGSHDDNVAIDISDTYS